jgi:hypothetical protein
VEAPSPQVACDAAMVANAAVGLAGYEVCPFTRGLIAKMGRGELTGDQAVAAVIARFAGRPQK